MPKRQEFQERLKTKSATEIVYVDEAGIDNRDEYPYGYCEIGQRFHAAVFCGGMIPPQTNLLKSGKRTERVSWIAALKQGDIFAPMTFAGSCNRDLLAIKRLEYSTFFCLEMCLAECLLPKLQPGGVKAGGRKNYSPGTLPHCYR